jgi:hypothetical protein
MPKWQGPAKITEINDTNARLQLPNGKTKINNVMRLKKFFAPSTENPASETDAQPSDFDFNSSPKMSPCHMGNEKINPTKRSDRIGN